MDGSAMVQRAVLAAAVVLVTGGGVNSSSAEPGRVASARQRKMPEIRRFFEEAGAAYPPSRLFIRAYKLERELEVWAPGKDQRFTLVRSYPVCTLSGRLGPKRREGDLQVPEGIYRIDRFNPQSQFHLSLGIDYPNPSDRQRSDPARPGGDIFIHGDCVTIGCLPITDANIEELYLIALDGKNAAGAAPVVHIYPCRMGRDQCRRELERLAGSNPELGSFWDELMPVHDYFEKERLVPKISIDGGGAYRLVPD